MGYDYVNMTPKQALALAWDTADDEHRRVHGKRLTREIIANRTGLGVEHVQRMFALHDEDYHPSYRHIAILCRALGNTILLDHLAAQLKDMLPESMPITSTDDLARRVVEIGSKSGAVQKATHAALEDGILEPHETSAIQGEIAEAVHALQTLHADLQAVSGQVVRCGRIETISLSRKGAA